MGAAKVFLTKNAILAAPDSTTEELFVPEWKGSVTVRSLTGKERDKFESDSLERRGKNVQANVENVRARLVALTVVDADGKRLFADEDVAKLGDKNASALDRIFSVSMKLSGIGAKDVEDIAGN